MKTPKQTTRYILQGSEGFLEVVPAPANHKGTTYPTEQEALNERNRRLYARDAQR